MKKWVFNIIIGIVLALIVISFFAQAFYGYIIQDDDILVFNALIDMAFSISIISFGFLSSVFFEKKPMKMPKKEKPIKVSKKKLG